MHVHTFLAESAVDAVAQIRDQLGPQAVVLNVRPVPPEGLSRLWQKPRIEVLAYLPDQSTEPVGSAAEAMAQLRQEMSGIKQRVEGKERESVPVPEGGAGSKFPESAPLRAEKGGEPGSSPSEAKGNWRIGTVLENSGLLPVHAHRVLEQLRVEHGDTPPLSLGRELDMAGLLLRDLWQRRRSASGLTAGAHVLVGAPGVGKTVCLCKWLAQAVLVEGNKASVWRLDGKTANTAEALSIYCEILAVPVERCLPEREEPAETELLLIDLPGVNWSDAGALAQLGEQIQQLPNPQVHLVLNAAYESPLLLNQARAFAALPVTDVIFTHLDEEQRWGKVWNVVLGTNFTVSFLSAGQNVPGVWVRATPEQILSRQFPTN
jgi:flagellar biosynthesis protein FlhF